MVLNISIIENNKNTSLDISYPKLFDEYYGGIYIIINLIDGKQYIGQTTNKWGCRWLDGTLNMATKVYSHNPHLINSMKKNGVENFKLVKLLKCYNKKDLDFFEDYYIVIWDTTNPKKGYNKRRGGSRGKLSKETKRKISETKRKNPQIFTEEIRRKMSEAQKGKILKPESRRKISKANKGKKNGMYGNSHTEEAKKKISDGNKGKIVSEEAKIKMSIAKKGCIPWNKGLTKETDERVRKYGEANKGKIVSEETRKKLSEAMKGKIAWSRGLTKETDERVKKMSESKKGYIFTEEHRKNLSETMKGKPSPRKGKHHTEESKKKMSESAKGRPPISAETKKKMSESHKGKIPWNKGLRTPKVKEGIIK